MKLACRSAWRCAVCAMIVATLAGCRSMNLAQKKPAVRTRTIAASAASRRPAGKHAQQKRAIPAAAAEASPETFPENNASGANLMQAAQTQNPVGGTPPVITNHDVVNMTRSNVPDNVIINAIRSRGGRFDTSPEAIILLYENQVSEQVIRQMQQSGPS